VDAALQAARLRLRPVLMTSFCVHSRFVYRCGTASGAGSVARQIMGTAVIGGMLAGEHRRHPSRSGNLLSGGEDLRRSAGARGARLSCFRRLGKETEMNYRAMAILLAAGLDDGVHGRTELSPAGRADAAGFPRSGSAAGPAGGVFRRPEMVGGFLKTRILQQLVRTALQQNYDLREAVARVEAARANLGITRSDQFPASRREVGDLQFTRLSRKWRICSAPLVLWDLKNRNWG